MSIVCCIFPSLRIFRLSNFTSLSHLSYTMYSVFPNEHPSCPMVLPQELYIYHLGTILHFATGTGKAPAVHATSPTVTLLAPYRPS